MIQSFDTFWWLNLTEFDEFQVNPQILWAQWDPGIRILRARRCLSQSCFPQKKRRFAAGALLHNHLFTAVAFFGYANNIKQQDAFELGTLVLGVVFLLFSSPRLEVLDHAESFASLCWRSWFHGSLTGHDGRIVLWRTQKMRRVQGAIAGCAVWVAESSVRPPKSLTVLGLNLDISGNLEGFGVVVDEAIRTWTVAFS